MGTGRDWMGGECVARPHLSPVRKSVICIDTPGEKIYLAPINFRLQERQLGLLRAMGDVNEPSLRRPTPFPVPAYPSGGDRGEAGI